MTIQEFITSLFEIRITGHIAHFQTRSYAQHIALGELYTGIEDLTDSYVEAYQGISGIITSYPQIKIAEGVDMTKYLQLKVSMYRDYRKVVKETELQQKVDDIIEFLNTIIYKLKYLG